LLDSLLQESKPYILSVMRGGLGPVIQLKVYS